MALSLLFGVGVAAALIVRQAGKAQYRETTRIIHQDLGISNMR